MGALCLLSKGLLKKAPYHLLYQSQLVYPINAVVSSDNGCKKMHTLFNLLAKRTAMVSKLVSLNPTANAFMQSANNGIIPMKTIVGLLMKAIFSSLCRKCRFFISEIYSCFF